MCVCVCVCVVLFLESLQHIFIAYDEDNMYTYVYSRDTVRGEYSGTFLSEHL